MISLRGLLLWCLGLSLVGLLSGAGVVAKLYSKKPFNRITYSDLVLPWRWSHIDALRGQANLSQAADDLKTGKIRSGITYLRSGLARYPGDTNSRLQLATIYILLRKRLEAEKTLLQAFDSGYPGSDYIHKSVELLQKGDNPELLLTFCDLGRAANASSAAPSSTDARFLDGVKVKALLELMRSDEAVQLVEKYQPKDLPFLQMTRVLRALAHEAISDAEVHILHWLTVMPDSEEALATGVRVYRIAGKVAEMQALILKLRSRYPDNPNHVSLGISENILAGQIQAAFDLLDISVIRFSNRPSVYGDWAAVIGETGNIGVLSRLAQRLTESNNYPQSVILVRMMTAIRLKEWTEAAECSARLQDSIPPLSAHFRSIFDVAKALLETCTQPVKGAQNTLANTITGGWVGLYLYRQVIDSLSGSERYEAALEIITLAEGYFPSSRYIAAQRTSLTAKLETQNADFARIAAQNAQSSVAKPTFADADAFFAACEAEIEAGRIPNAQRLIRAVRDDAPAWLAGVQSKLEWREIQLAALADDMPLLQLNLRTTLRTATSGELDRAVTQAKAWFAEKRRSSALIAIREVLKMQPTHAEAANLLVEWDPASKNPESTLSVASLPKSAEELFKTIDADLASGESVTAHAEAGLRLARAVRRSDPEWLVAAMPELEWREILLAAIGDDIPQLQLNLRTYLRSRTGADGRCLNQARAWHSEGKNSLALHVVREVLRQSPEHPAATKLLTDWAKP